MYMYIYTYIYIHTHIYICICDILECWAYSTVREGEEGLVIRAVLASGPEGVLR